MYYHHHRTTLNNGTRPNNRRISPCCTLQRLRGVGVIKEVMEANPQNTKFDCTNVYFSVPLIARMWQRYCCCPWLAAVSVIFHTLLVRESFRPHPWEREAPKWHKFPLLLLIICHHSICWPPLELFHFVREAPNKPRCAKGLFTIHSTFSTQQNVLIRMPGNGVFSEAATDAWCIRLALLTSPLHPLLDKVSKTLRSKPLDEQISLT